MTYEEVLTNAREVMAPKCKVCKICDGMVCRGQNPNGVGSSGNGMSFTECRKYLDKVKINLETIHEHNNPDTSIELFGKKLSLPVMVAPIGSMDKNYNAYLTEAEYDEAVVNGALDAGTIAWTGDGPNDSFFPTSLPIIEAAGGMAIPTIKPWDMEKVMNRISMINELSAIGFSMDVDAAGFFGLAAQGKPTYTKSEADIKAIVEASEKPFVVKGVMTANDAEKCARAGAYGIVISNHGGRVSEEHLPPVYLVTEIRERVGDRIKIIVDGGIRSGQDVFRCIALGADAVLIGRPYVIAAHGGRAEGVKLYTEKLIKELKQTMILTDCNTIADISENKIRNLN